MSGVEIGASAWVKTNPTKSELSIRWDKSAFLTQSGTFSAIEVIILGYADPWGNLEV